MKIKHLLFATAVTFATITSANCQESSSDLPSDFYVPQLFGVVKVKMELSTDNGMYRFDVRNSRIGVKGNASEHMKYAIQIDYNDEGKVSILDSWVGYHVGGFEFKLGQQQHHFSTDLDRGPSSNPFSNRSFLSKYITTYYENNLNGNVVRTIGSRDIGAYASYAIPNSIVKISSGVFNGSGANDPVWSKRANYVGRIDIGSGSQGLSGAVSTYIGSSPAEVKLVQSNNDIVEESFKQKVEMYDAYLRYVNGDLFLEAEYAQRRLHQDGLHLMQAMYVHGTYRFDVNNVPTFKYVAPHLRFDIGDTVEYLDKVTGEIDPYTSSRMTYAINIGLSEKRIKSELRLAYEDYFVRSEKPVDFGVNQLLHDKFTIEFVAAF